MQFKYQTELNSIEKCIFCFVANRLGSHPSRWKCHCTLLFSTQCVCVCTFGFLCDFHVFVRLHHKLQFEIFAKQKPFRLSKCNAVYSLVLFIYFYFVLLWLYFRSLSSQFSCGHTHLDVFIYRRIGLDTLYTIIHHVVWNALFVRL